MQETQQIPTKINNHISTKQKNLPRHTLSKVLKINDKKILKQPEEKKIVYYIKGNKE